MAVSLQVESVERLSRRGFAITYKMAFSGNYAQAFAEAVNFLNATNPKWIPKAFPKNMAPDEIISDSEIAGYGYEWQIGTDATNSGLKVLTGSGVELGAGAYPAALGTPTLANTNMRVTAVFRF